MNRTVKPFFAAFFFLMACAMYGQTVGIKVQNTAPDFEFYFLDGTKAKLSDYSGKPVFLHFWATWCPPCIRELPLIAKLEKELGAEIVVLAVNCAEPAKTISDFLSRRNLTMTTVLDTGYAISMLYQVNAIPQSFIIDRNGVIQAVKIGAFTETELDGAVLKVLEK
ncbi:TlpA family protein disulfide reductase [Brucepastera parasyntrophica]|uniref:TlpA family protein disulfide reductase n=1 Tax=Brucepastera parasyntrophica TaxID=2880008 RepID=UPI0021091D63|nr:TlpA disulfide reductase family protein [Brucepastera parasyntrophica]ULQ59667.1 TlpA family protein disulfide reductase [Brucepastera parasyntrophica]